MNQKSTSAPIAENKMGTMPVGRLVLNMSLPMMISMLVQALYNIVDSVFVAMLSENALTAVSMAFPLQTLLIAVGAGTGVGMNALLSKSLGEKNFKKADRTASNAAFLYGLSYLVFLILGFTVVYCLLICLQSLDTELLVHGDLRLYCRDQIIGLVYDFFIKLPDSLCRPFQSLAILCERLFLDVLRHIGKHRIKSYNNRCFCLLNLVDQLINHEISPFSACFLGFAHFLGISLAYVDRYFNVITF